MTHPWRTGPPKRGKPTNEMLQTRALRRMSPMEVLTGHDDKWWNEWHKNERKLVRSGARRRAA